MNDWVKWAKKTRELKVLLNQPLPGGRGFQQQRDQHIKRLCSEIAELELPRR